MDSKTIVLEDREYPTKIQDTVIGIFALFLFGLGLLMVFIETGNKIISRYSILIGVVMIIIMYLNKYLFRKPEIKGLINISFDNIDFLGTLIRIEDIDYLAIRYMDYRGKFIFKRHEYPLPRFGTNNEIKLKVKSGLFYESNFYLAKRKDRNKIDEYIKYWIDKGIKLDYLIGDELIITNK